MAIKPTLQLLVFMDRNNFLNQHLAIRIIERLLNLRPDTVVT